VTGYMKFAAVLRQSYIQPESLSLLGTNAVPMDCNLLVIAGPRTVIPQLELGKIEQYLKEGGRLLALFNFAAINKETGLEALLTKWGWRSAIMSSKTRLHHLRFRYCRQTVQQTSIPWSTPC